MKGIPKIRRDRDAVVVAVLGSLVLSTVLIAILTFFGAIAKPLTQTLVDTVVSIASLSIALATVGIYIRQNSIIEEQTRATIQARKASVQTLDMAATDSGQDIVVELSNSGGGAARNLRGVVEFEAPDSYGIDSKPYRVTGRRRSSVGDRSEQRTWLASEGNTIAAGEEQVPVEIQCAVNLPGYDRPLGFPAAVRALTDYWREAQLSQLESALSTERLEEIGERWDEQAFLDMADPSQSVDPGLIEIEDLIQISTTVATSDGPFSESEIVDTDVRLKVSLEYVDEYVDSISKNGNPQSIDLDENPEVPVLDATFPVTNQISLDRLFEKDYRTERREMDPEGSALRI